MGSMKDQLGDSAFQYRETSRAAFESIKPVSGDLDRAIVDAVKAGPVDGVTCESIEQTIGRKHQAVSGNLRHLVERGILKHGGAYGRTASGRRAMRWVIA